ncbi:VWA domain-containing protein [Sulfidibacter corallicola]|uniref:VWA domain-containing protein n=1 Tax=Sulfidibacter corallicola TaxID=2818388 RepID=A0A8A4TTH9_SULCO|nr:vWA domain-containing protein [Sulfidibacter corallicola]QTD49845.1 VWA domain-containing protein [Sulfidibacter corallicola]
MRHTLLLPLFFALPFVAAENTYLELILDASGSMWNKLDDGRYRIVAAKDVLATVIQSLPADRDDLHVGLRIYGSRVPHREEGACEDSLLAVNLRGVDRDQLLKAVRRARAVGATPIALSLLKAAEDFPAEGRKRIVLVTDGLESCDGDLKAAVTALRANGVEIDLHIIGLDLDPTAVDVFSRYATIENVTSAKALAEALTKEVGQSVALDETHYDLRVVLKRQGKVETTAKATLVDPVTEEARHLDTKEDHYHIRAKAGSYRLKVVDLHAGTLEFNGIAVAGNASNRYEFELVPERKTHLEVTPTTATAGGEVTLRFRGAPSEGEPWVTIVTADTPDGTHARWTYIQGPEGETKLRCPDEPGPLEARLIATLPSGIDTVLARAAFTGKKAAITLAATAPNAGTPFQVDWTGPNNPGDYVTIVPENSPPGTYKSWAYTKNGSPLQLTAPTAEGHFELRYVSDAGTTLHTVPIRIKPLSVSLKAPEQVNGGAAFEVSWEGPNASGDYITIVAQASPPGSYLSYAYTRAGKTVSLEAPLDAGPYEIRYVSDADSSTLAKRPIEVKSVETTLEVADTLTAGQPFPVRWQGPNASSDYLTIVPRGADDASYGSYAYTRHGNPLNLTAPDEPGDYEVRYNNEASARVLARVPVKVK